MYAIRSYYVYDLRVALAADTYVPEGSLLAAVGGVPGVEVAERRARAAQTVGFRRPPELHEQRRGIEDVARRRLGPVALDELGVADNTIVMFSTDNGAASNSWPDGGNQPFRGQKGVGAPGAAALVAEEHLLRVITSYSIHYTKLYEPVRRSAGSP